MVIIVICFEVDEVILLILWYFNYKMWLDMFGIYSVLFVIDSMLLFDLECVKVLIIDKICVIVLVIFNNSGGVEYLLELVCVFFEFVKIYGLKFIVDEIY